MKLIFASGNLHKLQEMQDLLGEDNHSSDGAPIILELEASPEKLEVIEDGNTYYENAYLKAIKYFQRFKRPVLADDSGLDVPALPCEMGVKTADFGGKGITQLEKNQLLLSKMNNSKDRSAEFVCVLCIVLSSSQIYFFEGRLAGSIAFEASGEEGFGYDPIFIPRGETKTFADAAVWKNCHSHRFMACQEMKKFLISR